MFDSMYFEKKAKVDKNGRLLVPYDTGVTPDVKIAVASFENYYGLYLLERIDALVDKLNEAKLKVSAEEKENILNDLHFIFNAIKMISETDSQRRITMPSELTAKPVILQGRKDYIALFTEEGYEEFKKGLKPSTILK